MIAPDPVLAFNVYSGGTLDVVLREALAPVLAPGTDGDPAAWEGWFVRYARRGEHLKVRLHGPAGEAEALRMMLSEKIRPLLARLSGADAGAPRVSRPDAPAIDAEDETAGDHPDHALTWTRYRRSAVSLGPEPWPGDDGYAARMTACLAAGARLAIEALAQAGPAGASPAARQRVLLRALVEGLGALNLDRAGYLAYHRGWLLRFVADDAEREAAALAGFEAQAARSAATVRQLAGVLDAAWGPAPAPAPEPGGFGSRIAELHRYAGELAADPAYDVDPFAPGAAHPPLFKAFHGLANQLGVEPAAEAFVHHLLLRACPGVDGAMAA